MWDSCLHRTWNCEHPLFSLYLVDKEIKGLPRSGGEKNYLEFIYRKPKFMATCTFTAYTLIMVFLFGPPPLCHLFNTFRVRPQRIALYLANVGCPITVVSRYFNSSCRSSPFIVHRTDLVPYSSSCLLLLDLYLSGPRNSAQGGRPSSKRVRIIQACRPCSDFCLWSPVSGRVQTRAGSWRVWKTWQL